MARIRTVKPEFFRHERLFEAERESGLPLRIAFAGLWTAADREGRFRWQPRALKLDCLPYDDVDFSEVLDVLHAHGLIGKYETDDGVFGFVPSWQKHQHVNQRELQSSLPEPTSENIIQAGARTCKNIPARGEGKGREGKGNDIRTVAKATRPERDEKFEEFKKAYPKRKGGNPWKPAKDLWLSALKRGVEPDAIIAAVKAGTGFDRDKIGTEFIPQAVKWLRDQRFDDFEKPEEAAAVSGYYAEFGSAQLDAWDAYHRKSTGHGMPRDRKGGWRVDTEWPPGHDPPKGGAEFERGRAFSESIQ